MRLFTLKATLGQTKRFQTFEAKNDADAIGVGALRVLTLAYPNAEPWATGCIELFNQEGELLAEMGEKA
jgi:hypothetical protein